MKGIDISGLPGNPIKEWIKVYNTRTRRNEIVGVMVGCQHEGDEGRKYFAVDYSLCNIVYDNFEPEKAVKIAYGRAFKCRPRRIAKRVVDRECGWEGSGVMLSEKLIDFAFRCKAYYKDCEPTGKAALIFEDLAEAK